MLHFTQVKAYEVALQFKNNRLVNVLTEGKYWNFGFNMETYIYNTLDFAFTPTLPILIMIENLSLKSLLNIFEVKENEIMVVKINGNIFKVYKTGIYAFWKINNKAEFIILNTSDTNPIKSLDRATLENPQLNYFIRKKTIENYQIGLLYVDGKLTTNLESGTYYWFMNPTSIEVKSIDTRFIPLDIVGQEVLSKDKATLRINFYARYRVNDPVKAVSNSKEFEKQIYATAQIVLREAISNLTIDELMVQKTTIGNDILSELQTRTEKFSIEFSEAAIRDVILPGEMREIMNQVLIAEKKAQANIIMRREETASVRSMLNTAKLMEENPTLWKLKEMEYVEKIADKVGEITISGKDNVLNQLREIFVK